MQEMLKKILTANRVQLVGNITLDVSLWNQLLAKEILNEEQRDRIILNNTMDEQIGKLLDLIARGHDKVFDDLRQCLYNTNQAHVADTWLHAVRMPGPAPFGKRGPSAETADGNKKRPRNIPSQPSNPPSSRELPAPSGASCSQEGPSPEKGTDSDVSFSPNTLLRLFRCKLDELNEIESADDRKQCLPKAISNNLRNHTNTLSEMLDLIKDLLMLLVREDCMHPRSQQLILANHNGTDQAREVIEFISRSHLHTYKVFLKFLQCTKQSHLFDILNTGDVVISSIVKIRVELYMNSFVYNELESLRQLYKQVQTDICSEESKISKLLKSFHPHLEALSVDMGSMIIYVWSPCLDASTSIQKACDSGDLGQRIQSMLIHITGTCLYDPRVVETCIQDKTQPSLVPLMSSLTLDINPYKVSQLRSPTNALSGATTWRPHEGESSDSGSSLIGGFCAQLSKAGSISPEVAFHVQDSVEEDEMMTRLMEGLGFEQDMSTKVEAVVCSNTGSFDLLLNSLVGVFGNSKYHHLLTPVLGEDGVDETASKRASYVVGMILKSKRRFFKNGIEFCLRVVASSQQRELIDALTNVIGTRWLTSDDPDTLMAADLLRLSEMKTNPVRLQVSGLGYAKYYPQATSLANVGEITAAGVMKECQHLNNVTSICFEKATITYEVTEVLSRITSLDALCFADTDVGISSKLYDKRSSFWSVFAISVQYLRLSSCGLTSGDVEALLATFGRLKHLDISGNAAIKHVKAGSLSSLSGLSVEWMKSKSSLTGLSVEGTNLTDDDLIQLVEGSRGSLVFLNASSLSMSPESCCDIIALCPQLREFYVRGDGLLEALHLTRGSIEHLHHTDCTESINYLPYVSITCITDDEHMAQYDFLEQHLVDCSNQTQLWLGGIKSWDNSEFARLINQNTSLHTVGLQVDLPYPGVLVHFLKALERPLKRLWLVVSKKEEYADVIEETEKRLGATPGMIQLVTDPDGLYGTYTRESGVFYTHLPDTLPNDFRPVIGKP